MNKNLYHLQLPHGSFLRIWLRTLTIAWLKHTPGTFFSAPSIDRTARVFQQLPQFDVDRMRNVAQRRAPYRSCAATGWRQ